MLKVLILSNNENSYVKPLSDGLSKAITTLGHDCEVIEQGHLLLDKHDGVKFFKKFTTNFLKTVASKLLKKYFKIEQNEWITQRNKQSFNEKIKYADLIIVTAHIPNNFLSSHFSMIEDIRKTYNIPIVNYDLVYLPTRPYWKEKIKQSNASTILMDRYDWYLSVSFVSEEGLKGHYHPFHHIGLDITHRDLQVSPKTFVAIIDFPQKGFEAERNLQLEVLKELNMPFIKLESPLSKAALFKIYRKGALFFLSFRESFGLPIVENQLCGNKIATPYAHWVPSHQLKNDYTQDGEGTLNGNFLVYNNDKETLKKMLLAEQKNYNSTQIYKDFEKDYPFYNGINKTVLSDFLNKIEEKSIHSETHLQHKILN
jgi:hypothetical protein